MRSPVTRAATAMAAMALLLVPAGCGGGDDTSGPLSAGTWRERVNGFCGDGLEEATALPLPDSPSTVAADAASRADIDASVRDGVLTLGTPDGIDPSAVSAYVDQLSADIDLLGRIADAPADEAQALNSQIDETAGQAAGQIGGIDDCAALANAIARTP